jgi:MFS family permease
LGLLIFQTFSIEPESARGVRLVANLFMYAGFVGALAQGGTGRLVKKLGEPKLIAVSLFLVAISLGPLPFARHWPEIYVLLAILGIGSSLTRPPVFGMISHLTDAREQGVTIGVAQGAGALARIVGPIFAAVLFTLIPPLPYAICAGLAFLTGILAWIQLSKDNEPAMAVGEPNPEV